MPTTDPIDVDDAGRDRRGRLDRADDGPGRRSAARGSEAATRDGDRSPLAEGRHSTDDRSTRPTSGARRPRRELRRIDALNAAVRDVLRALADVSTDGGIEAALDELTGAELYDAVAVLGPIDQWQRSDGGDDLPPAAEAGALAWRDRTAVPAPVQAAAELPDEDRAAWALVPVRRGGSTYGHVALATTSPGSFGERELAILERFGETLGLAADAIADRLLLRSDAVAELTVESAGDALAAVAAAADCSLSVDGLVPADQVLAYLRTDGADASRVADAATDVDGVAAARATGGERVELSLAGRSAVVPLARGGTNLRTVAVDEDAVTVVLEVAPGTDVRALVERIARHVADASLAAKRYRSRPPSTDCPNAERADGPFAELTDRQREIVEAAYRAGYFQWPREQTAEEVAASLGVSSPTLHRHLRKAERSVLSTLLEGEDEREEATADRRRATPE